MTLKEAVGKVLEGWTLPNSVRKILEEAYFAEPQRTWVGMMRGVRVDGDTVVISTKNNDAARELCGELINEINK